jgi:S-adenosylmethionine-diacylglycerol 3-amino-3-carboxypropyl transferase
MNMLAVDHGDASSATRRLGASAQSDSAYLRSAVLNAPAVSTRGALERLFALWFSRLVYNQIWEDPAVDLEALALEPDMHLVTIASAGCNVLNYLAAAPAEVTAVDLNPAHLALTRLKIAALQRLPDHDSFFRFFGEADDPGNRQAYDHHIRPHLDAETRRFWDSRTLSGACQIDRFRRGFYRHGQLGRFVAALHILCRLHGRDPGALTQAGSLDEQRRLFDETIAPLFRTRLVRALAQLPVAFYGLGIPPAQYAAMRHGADGAFADELCERLRRLACNGPIADNYFAWQAFARTYDRERRRAVPDYLKAEHFETLRERIERIGTVLATMTAFLARQPRGSVDRYVLLDAQDWMSRTQLNALWREILRTARPGARVVFRTAAADSPLEAALAPELMAHWHADKALAASLHARDRSGIYGGFHLYSLVDPG